MTAQFKRRQLLKLLGAGSLAVAGAGQALAGRAWWESIEGFGHRSSHQRRPRNHPVHTRPRKADRSTESGT